MSKPRVTTDEQEQRMIAVEFQWIEAWDGLGSRGWYRDEALWESRDTAQLFAFRRLDVSNAHPMSDWGNEVAFRIAETTREEHERLPKVRIAGPVWGRDIGGGENQRSQPPPTDAKQSWFMRLFA